MTTPVNGTATRRTTTAKAPSGGTTTSGAEGKASVRRDSLQAHLSKVMEGEVLAPTALHEFLESWRALHSGLAFAAYTASSQLTAAIRKGARDAADGRLTLTQKMELAHVLRRTAKLMDGTMAEAALASAKGAVTAWSKMEDFLDKLESDGIDRPHRRGSGGFNTHGGR
jgi:hypothetical protein